MVEIDNDFMDYLDNAIKQFEEYKNREKEIKITFSDFLLLIQVWKLEEILERLEEGRH